jgi:hypothetical protein
MGFSTPATRETDIPIIETQPRRLPSPLTAPWWDPERVATPAREPETVPAKRGWK